MPEYTNPYNLILTFANDISEEHARNKYSLLIRKLSKRILRKGYEVYRNKIEQRGYLEVNTGSRFHMHTLVDVRSDWDTRFKTLVCNTWKHGLVTEIKKVPVSVAS